MPLFAYKAITAQGSHYSGYRFSPTREAICQSLKAEGLHLVKCEETQADHLLPTPSKEVSKGFFKKISRTLLMDFCHHMSQLDAAGVPLDKALHDLALSTSHGKFRMILRLLYEEVQAGIPLSMSLANYPHIFDRVFQEMIKTAELAGAFAPSFRHLENYLRQQDLMSRQIRKSLRSPLILFLLITALVLVMIELVIPSMGSLLISLGFKELPLSTRLLIHTSTLLAYLPLVLLALGGCLGVGLVFSGGRYHLSRLALNLPFYKPWVLNQFWHVFGIMIEAGIELLPSLTQAIEVVKNPYMREQLSSLVDKITAGTGLSQAFREVDQKTPLLSPVMLRLLSLSEQTGSLRKLVPQAATHYQTETFRRVEAALFWIEPALVLAMGGFMLWIVLAIIVPLYSTIGAAS